MARVRTFVAVGVSPDLAAKVEDLVRELSIGIEGVKWVAPEKLHFTLKFLGDVEDSDLHEICRAVALATEGLSPFQVVLAGAGAFPSVRRPRTVWVGVADGQEQLVAAQKVVDRALRKLGFPRESRKFTPHVTLGRIRRQNPTLALLSERLVEHATTELGASPVREALVLASDLGPAGPEYHVLGRAPLVSQKGVPD
jgi:2'-5' RNA ligase